MTRSIQLLAGLCCVWGLAGMSPGAEPGVVFLHGGRDSALPDGTRNYQGLLARELMRQALLCAARDELSCATYDLHLGQPAPAGATHLDIVAVRGVDRTDGPKTELEILSGEPPRQELLVASTFIPKPGADLVELLRLFEARSRGSFVKNLEAAGVSGTPRPWNKNVPAEDTLKALAEMSFVSQFRAACELHAQIEEGGRSPALVAALSRAYANLAVLTELHWAPAHKVFAARALLYAQRLVAGKHDNTNALGSRAYAYALVGLHQAALDDLDELDRLAKEKRARPGELHRILRSYCTFDIDKLDPQACEPRHVEFVRLLRLLAREQSGGTRQTIEEAMLVSKAMPHCYRAQDSVGARAGVSLGHVVTVQAIVLTTQTLYRQLSAFPDMPKDLKTTIPDSPAKAKGAKEAPITAEEFPRRAKLITAFQRNEMPVGKQRQLTWSVFGHLIAEHSFLEVYRRARFEGRMLAAAPDQFLDVVKPLYEWHRFAAVADFLRKNSFEAEQTLTRAGQIDLDTIELQSGDLVQVVPKEMDAAAQCRKDEANFLAINHMDHTASDLLRRYPYWANERAKEEADKAYAISPHSPAVRAHLVTHHWKKIEPQLEQWLRDAAGDASEQAALGLHYQREKEWDKAIEFLQRARDLSPELVNIRLLAEAYRSQGKIEQWQATLEELLKQPDYGLEHAKVRVEIADHYIGRHEYSKALPFALQAAGTHAEWGLLEAAQCYEALQKWDEAEDMYRAASQGYQNFQWFLFTRRTGHGNVEEAKQWARQSLPGNGRNKTTPLTLYYILRALDDREGSRSHLEEMYAKGSDPVAGLHLAMLADERKDFARRDAVLAELLAAGTAKAGGGPRLGLIALVEAFANDLAAGGKAAFDPQVLLEARIGAPQGDVAAFEYLLGKYLLLHGNRPAAEKIWLERMSRNIMSHYNRTLCGMELRALGVGPEAYKEKLQKPLAADQPSDSPPK